MPEDNKDNGRTEWTEPRTTVTLRQKKGPAIAKRLEETNRHPVLIFGSSKSGKSSLILSIINALANSEEASVTFADNEPVLDNSDPTLQEQAHATARHFYDWGLQLLDAGNPPRPTAGERFFIPIDVQPKNSTLPPVKFAILDGRGEDYEARANADDPDTIPVGDVRRELGLEIKQLLQEFTHEITVIYVAPFSKNGNTSSEARVANAGLRHVLQNYQTARVLELRQNDSHLLLLTKWDEHANPLSNRTKFAEPTSIDVANQLKIDYQNAWGQFCGLPVSGAAKNRRVFMQYSSGYFIDGSVRPPPDLVADTYRRYPRTVANWLYSRAAMSSLRRRQLDETQLEEIFPDVRLEQPKPTLSDRMINWIIGDIPS